MTAVTIVHMVPVYSMFKKSFVVFVVQTCYIQST